MSKRLNFYIYQRKLYQMLFKSKQYIISTSLLVAISVVGFSQKNTNKDISVLKNEQTNKKLIKNTFLTGTQRISEKGFFPYYSEVTPTGYGNIPTLTILTSLIRELTFDEISQIETFKKYITSDFDLTYHTATSRYTDYIYCAINAIRLNTATNKYELLEEYTFEWHNQISNSNVSNSTKKTATNSYAANSVLATGDWYKIGVTQNGVYKIDKALLSSLGVDVTTINPLNIRIYGNGGKLLPEQNNLFRYDDLQENAIEVVGEADGIFDATDYILFYGQSTDSWKLGLGNGIPYQHVKHLFSDTSYYYITTDLGPGKRVSTQISASNIPNKSTSKQDYYGIHEADNYNVVKSGREFYGEKFDFNTTYSFPFAIQDAAIGDSLYVSASILGRASGVSTYNVNYNNGNFNINCSGTNLTDYLADIGYVGSNYNGSLLGSNNLIVTINKQTPAAVAWIDKIEFNCRRNLIFNQLQFNFRDRLVIGGVNSFAQYNLLNYGSIAPTIWDVTNPLNPKKQLYNIAGNAIDFVSTADSLKEFCIYKASQTYIPTKYGKIKNQNLHGIQQADFIIVTHPLFLTEALRLAKLHEEHDTLTYAVATTQEVYNEFSSGTPDITAIRDFARMLYSKPNNSNLATKYLLLFGDGSYKNKDLNTSSNSALIPTYETPSSASFINSLVSDDFYGMMDDNEGDLTLGLVDIGIGRFPVRIQAEGAAIVDKIAAYYKLNKTFDVNAKEYSCAVNNEYPQGDWRNRLTFVADDEDGNLHLNQANGLANSLAVDENYNVNKIFLDSYVQLSTPGGDRYPEAVADINTSIEKGCLIWNYTGHGGEVGLAEERIIEIAQIQKWKNINNLPLMVTATCEFSRYDDPDRTSAGELCLLQPEGGAIGLFTTTRVAFSDKNEFLNKKFFNHAIVPIPLTNKMPKLGDLYRLTKIDVNTPNFSTLQLNFTLLGDPALQLAYPQQKIYTTTINTHSVNSSNPDTLKALSKITITGFVGDKLGNKLTNFNGVIYPTVLDKGNTITTLSNDPPASGFAGSPVTTFTIQKNNIYRGKATVTNGNFSFSFLVPKDISYNYGQGKISYYAHNGVIDAQGYNDNIIIGGENTNAIPDNQGPNIGLYMNDDKFINGGVTNETPKIYAAVSDSSGINTLGTGIGHDIVAVLDANSAKPIILNDYYTADLNTYQTGKIKYPFNELPEGNHSISLKVWDVQNNSTLAQTDFVVTKKAELALKHILNYPNPFTTKTKFFIEHNQCCSNVLVLIQIYTISGKVVKSITHTISEGGFRLDGIEWDGKDEFGDKLAKGVYIYKVQASDGFSKKAEKIEKLVILN